MQRLRAVTVNVACYFSVVGIILVVGVINRIEDDVIVALINKVGLLILDLS